MNHYSRKSFLKQAAATGAILSLPAILQNCSSLPKGRFQNSENLDPILGAKESGLHEPLLQILATGTTAPNPHNVQPWNIKILNDSECLLYVDQSRLLPMTDPFARQIHIGQGAFLEHAALGAGKAEYACKIKVFPNGNYKNVKQGKPIAKISIEKSSKTSVDPLYNVISSRFTNRKAYENYKPTAIELAAIKKFCKPQYSKLNYVTEPQKLQQLNEMFYEAMAIECRTYRTYDESRHLFRYNDKEIFEKRDGISLRAGGMEGLKLWIVSRVLRKGKESWHDKSNIKIYLDGYRDTMSSTQAVAFLKTPGNNVRNWVDCGRDYARLHLALTRQGLVMHPLSQILQEYPEMDKLRMSLNKIQGIQKPEHLQMAIRIGKASPSFTSPRRLLKDIIV